MGLQFNEQRRAFMDKKAEHGDERPDGSVMVRGEVLCLHSEFFKPRITVQLHNGDTLVAQLWSWVSRSADSGPGVGYTLQNSFLY
jgi:hypothetical protein